MNRLEILEKKVKQAAQQLADLRDDKAKLEAELEFLREENKAISGFGQESSKWKAEKKAVFHRIEKVLKKLNSIKV
ncbi:MAG TPA: hypothetical protein DEE98_07775 [Elusimicrobia bacterium]|nr:MAG: hypothetical protein A2278_00610 [Elusimicrobia bacterium RIFOXYA12_FULL_49_49]OGS08830.1 MAG: hypothetical protein A2204_04165 [Elusimicrobia bacterium RIFOXYA1_FULL_47_7]OGS11004.1 MAG: hypothetical protein A2386_00295 [Elusimicrobia bacterium RIFOXYB1_FULL_48_9]OGS15159.1 MAG: hypothetical protein A2251_00620 [Elusimicrobia bacterium RIFOXYA2_FULL_47_53]OGS29779.1 MAG: hypothetical protein A2323_01420 [Elusimicrobia bacterium RIFOXYB2_FULL_46_23]HBU70261.1 hypothetical protein [Elus